MLRPGRPWSLLRLDTGSAGRAGVVSAGTSRGHARPARLTVPARAKARVRGSVARSVRCVRPHGGSCGSQAARVPRPMSLGSPRRTQTSRVRRPSPQHLYPRQQLSAPATPTEGFTEALLCAHTPSTHFCSTPRAAAKLGCTAEGREGTSCTFPGHGPRSHSLCDGRKDEGCVQVGPRAGGRQCPAALCPRRPLNLSGLQGRPDPRDKAEETQTRSWPQPAAAGNAGPTLWRLRFVAQLMGPEKTRSSESRSWIRTRRENPRTRVFSKERVSKETTSKVHSRRSNNYIYVHVY